ERTAERRVAIVAEREREIKQVGRGIVGAEGVGVNGESAANADANVGDGEVQGSGAGAPNVAGQNERIEFAGIGGLARDHARSVVHEQADRKILSTKPSGGLGGGNSI